MLGQQLGSYRIDSLLGAGGMGEVYRAFDESLQRPVAVKVLHPTDAGDVSAGARLLREARAAAALNHPHICTIHEVGELQGRHYIAMELVEGEALDRVIPAGVGLPVDDVLKYGLQIADALAHAHDSGVLHRDLKSPNSFAARPPMPERISGPSVSCFMRWAAGARPFDGLTAYDLTAAILNEPPCALPDRVPDGLRSVIARCLEKNPADRFQSAADLRTALEAIRDGHSPPLARVRRRTPATRRALATALAALLLVVAGAAIGLNVRGLRDRLWHRPPLYDSVAVLPLRAAAGDPDRTHVAAGIQQALISELAQLDGLTKVVAAGGEKAYERPDTAV